MVISGHRWRFLRYSLGPASATQFLVSIVVPMHDHASEQPFTRSQSGIEIPVEVASVTVQGRDQQSGYGGTSMIFDLVRADG